MENSSLISYGVSVQKRCCHCYILESIIILTKINVCQMLYIYGRIDGILMNCQTVEHFNNGSQSFAYGTTLSKLKTPLHGVLLGALVKKQ